MTDWTAIFAIVRVFALRASGTEMTPENNTIPRIEPKPNTVIYINALVKVPNEAATTATKAAEPAMPCIVPTARDRKGKPV